MNSPPPEAFFYITVSNLPAICLAGPRPSITSHGLFRGGTVGRAGLRIALLSLVEPTGSMRVGALRVGGMSLVRHQLGLALALGCERVICVTASSDPEMPILRDATEDAGASFHAVPGVRGMLGLVSVADEVVAFAEGLLVWPELILPLIEAGPCVLAQPVERGLASGFERLDANHASAGAMRVPGRLIERLAPLPDDADPYSILQRVALQSGVPQRLLGEDVLAAGRWQLVRGEEDAHAVEAAWFRQHTLGDEALGPTARLARRAVRAIGPALLHAGSGGTVVAMAGAVLAALALVTGWFSLVKTGFFFAAGAWLLFLSASLFGRVERRSMRMARPSVEPMLIYTATLDMVLALLIVWGETDRAGVGLGHRAFAPVMLLGLIRLVGRVMPVARAVWLEDRALLALVLAGGALMGWLDGTILAAAAVVLGAGLHAVRSSTQLTSI